MSDRETKVIAFNLSRELYSKLLGLEDYGVEASAAWACHQRLDAELHSPQPEPD